MPAAEGYRVGRLRRRRQRRLQRWQLVFLVVLAVAVAFAAVAGAARLARWIIGGEPEPRRAGYLALVTFGEGEAQGPASALLALRDAGDGSVTLYTVPRTLLLEAPGGEYVLAGDMLAAGQLKGDLERLVGAEIDFVYRLPYRSLEELAGGEDVWVTLKDPVRLKVDGVERGYKGRSTVPAAQIGALLRAEGETGADEAAMQEALTRAVLQAAALRPESERERLIDGVAAQARGDDSSYLRELLRAATARDATVARLPSRGQTDLGQFAFRPDRDRIMAEITRRAPGFSAEVTVLVRNGSGELGVGEAVVERLAVLDVELPPPANADSFDYERTQILAGAETLPVAQDIRAILGRGVVLDGSDLGPATVVVIVGKDLKAKDLQ